MLIAWLESLPVGAQLISLLALVLTRYYIAVAIVSSLEQKGHKRIVLYFVFAFFFPVIAALAVIGKPLSYELRAQERAELAKLIAAELKDVTTSKSEQTNKE